MVQVSRSIELSAAPADVWAVAGPFQGLADWLPPVAKSVREDVDGVEHRRLTLADGAVVVEKHWGVGDGMSYGYEITDPGPLPVADYKAVLTVAPSGTGTVVVWCSTFTATGDGAEAAIAGVYESGFGTLKERFG